MTAALAALAVGLVLGFNAIRSANARTDALIDGALNHPRDGHPRAVDCPTHGRLCTVYSERDARLELEVHHMAQHEQVEL